jgi:hypothetical protein
MAASLYWKKLAIIQLWCHDTVDFCLSALCILEFSYFIVFYNESEGDQYLN